MAELLQNIIRFCTIFLLIDLLADDMIVIENVKERGEGNAGS